MVLYHSSIMVVNCDWELDDVYLVVYIIDGVLYDIISFPPENYPFISLFFKSGDPIQ